MQIKFMKQPLKFISRQDAPTRKRLVAALIISQTAISKSCKAVTDTG